MTFNRLLISSLISFCLCGNVFATEYLESFEDKSLSVLNDELRDLSQKITDNADAVAVKEIIGLIIENRTSDPSSPAVGQIWFRTDL